MAKKTITLETLAAQMQKGFASADKKFEALAEDISKLATKQDVATLGTQLAAIESELRDIKRRLTRFEDDATGYRKEIDHALERIATIEKHLGINKKIAA